MAVPRPVVEAEFVAYLEWVSAECELVVVDGSAPDIFAEHDRCWGHVGRHVAPYGRTPMGKVANVLTGIALASHPRVVIADDDVRFGPELHDLVARLDHAEVVRPQNYFDPLPWHAVWDSGRILLNRVWGGDWPGTLALRGDILRRAGGYAGDVMFENYELVKTIEAMGGRQMVASDLFVRRLPPTAGHFWSQRVRQAYDELARPGRLAVFLPVIPGLLALAVTGRRRLLAGALVAGAGSTVRIAEAGRRMGGARRRFPARCSLAAPLFVMERSVCVWIALAARSRGGVVYRDGRIRRAALSGRERDRLLRSLRTPPPRMG